MSADKTSNIYLVKPKKYKELLNKNVQAEYKKTSTAYALSKEKVELKLAEKLELEDRVHRSAQRDCFATLKDHKPGFRSNPQCRLLNPTKSELGKVAKQMLERVNTELRAKTSLKQWRRTSEAKDCLSTSATSRSSPSSSLMWKVFIHQSLKHCSGLGVGDVHFS